MANRVVLGNRSGSTFGLFVSKATKNVLTCGDNDLLFNSATKCAQVIYETTITIASRKVTPSTSTPRFIISHPSFGFIPFVSIQNISTTPVEYYTWSTIPISGVFVTPYEQTLTGLKLRMPVRGVTVSGVVETWTFNTTFRLRLLNFANPSYMTWPTAYTPVVDYTS